MNDHENPSPDEPSDTPKSITLQLEQRPLLDNRTREAICQVLRSRGVAAEIGSAERIRLIAEGDILFEGRHFFFALKIYAAADAKDKLVALADYCLDNGRPGLAAEAYTAAGQEIPREKILAALKLRDHAES